MKQSPLLLYIKNLYLLWQKLHRHAYVLLGAVATHGFAGLDALYHIETFKHFTKDGVLAVQMRSATYGGIGFNHVLIARSDT